MLGSEREKRERACQGSEEGVIEAYLPKNRGQGSGTPTIDLNEVRIKLLWYSRNGAPTTDKNAKAGGCVVLKVVDELFNNAGELEDMPMMETGQLWKELYEKLMAFKKPRRCNVCFTAAPP